jgi:hypothetical protein
MLIEYKSNTCNIKDCQNPIKDYFLCTEHLEKYVYDEKLIKILQRLTRIINKEATIKDKIHYKLYYFLHYSTGIHVKYIEHFPNETIFLYHLSSIYKEENKKFTTEEFISDFDYKENYEIDSLKVKFSKDKFKEPLVEYSEIKIKSSLLKFYGLLFIGYLLFLFIVNFFSFQSYLNSTFNELTLVFFLSYFIVKRGVLFFNNSKDLIKLAIDNKLYESKLDNNKFIINSHTTLRQIKSLEENKYGYYGLLISSFFISCGYFIYESYNKGYPIGSILLNIPIILTGSFMSVILFSFIWNNRFIIPLVRRIKNHNIKFRIYDLEKKLGISILKDFLKSLSSYNLVIILTFFCLQYFLDGVKSNSIIIYIVLFLIGWNFSSYIFIFRIKSFLKKQFKKEIKKEKKTLEKSNSNERFEKYSFINELKFELFPFKRVLIQSFKLFYPFAISYIISKHDIYIFELINKIIEFIKEI